MSISETLTLASYFFVLIILAVYGWHRYYLVYLYMRNKDKQPKAGPALDPLPVVTIQLPLYNEMYVADRLIEAVCAIEYPRDRFEIQVLDDSTDETRSIADLAVRRFAAQGYDIKYIHRTNRVGYKAGALEAASKKARGEFIAIFDADFVPPADILHNVVHYFTDDKIGMVQARWDHINRDYSLLTKIQSIFLDGHFVIEHTRAQSHRPVHALQRHGRRLAPHDDRRRGRLAARHAHRRPRSQLSRPAASGWQFVYLPELFAPAEAAVGNDRVQVAAAPLDEGFDADRACKLLPQILRAKVPLSVKAEAFFHLTANFNYPLMVVLSILMFPSMVIRYNMGWYEMMLIDVPLFFAATFSVCNFYMVCQREIHDDWLTRVKYLPFLMSIGIGLSINNTRAVFEALFNKHSEFARTPKYRIEGAADEWISKRYHQSVAVQPLIELALGLYFTATVFYALANQIYGTIPFLVLFQVGFLYTGLLSIVQQYAGDSESVGAELQPGRQGS